MNPEDKEFDMQVRRGLITIGHALIVRFQDKSLKDLLTHGISKNFLVRQRFELFGVAYFVKIIYNQTELRLEIFKA